nr:uncharacterized protein LOC107441386 isoform X2 [Parasteatoda tepidariorum]
MNVCFRKIEHLKMNLYIVLFLLFNSRFSFVESFLDVLQCVMCSAKTEELSKMYRKCHLKLPKQVYICTQVKTKELASKMGLLNYLVCIGEIEDKYCR